MAKRKKEKAPKLETYRDWVKHQVNLKRKAGHSEKYCIGFAKRLLKGKV